MKLDDRILRHFKIGVFVGVRRFDDEIHTAFFINGKEVAQTDLKILIGGLRAVPNEVSKAYEKMLRSTSKEKKRRRRKKQPKSPQD